MRSQGGTMTTNDLWNDVVRALGRDVKVQANTARARATWRGGKGWNVTLTRNATAAGGFLWHDHAGEGQGGNGVQLAQILGLDATDERSRTAKRLARLQEATERRAQAEKLADDSAAFAHQMREWWNGCEHPGASHVAVQWLESRHLTVRDADAAGVRSRTGAYALVLPVYDCNGELRTVRARWCRLDAPAPQGKERDVAGWKASPQGQVYACPRARRMLAGDSDAAAHGVVICEGGADWMTAVASYLDEPEPPAVLGIWSASMVSGPDLWQRIPRNVPVAICEHRDEAGARYTATIAPLIGNPDRLWVVEMPDWVTGPPMDLSDWIGVSGRRGVRALIERGQHYATDNKGRLYPVKRRGAP